MYYNTCRISYEGDVSESDIEPPEKIPIWTPPQSTPFHPRCNPWVKNTELSPLFAISSLSSGNTASAKHQAMYHICRNCHIQSRWNIYTVKDAEQSTNHSIAFHLFFVLEAGLLGFSHFFYYHRYYLTTATSTLNRVRFHTHRHAAHFIIQRC